MAEGTPFIGPRPFTEDESDLFFGRNLDIASLVADIISTQVVLLYAPSGCGKSSLISAGLIPAIGGEGFVVSRVRVSTLTHSDGKTPTEQVADDIEASARDSLAGRPSLMVLDQFEEILLAARHDELRKMADTIYRTMAKNPLARIVISFREEYLARIGALFTRPSDVSVSRFHLNRLSRAGALEAFERPLAAVGYRVEEEAAALFLERLSPPARSQRSEESFEPLYLQLLGSQLWSSISGRAPSAAPNEGSTRSHVEPAVSVSDVRGLIDFDQAIEAFFDDTIHEVCLGHDVSEKQLRDWIDRELVTPDQTRSMVRRQSGDTEGLPTTVLDELVTHGLLRTEPRGDDLWLELAHDQIVERVREFNRVWWAARINVHLVKSGKRLEIALNASMSNAMVWLLSRISLWNFGATVRDWGIRTTRWSRARLPFGPRPRQDERDRLALRAYTITATAATSAISIYRTSSMPMVSAVTGVEGLDPDSALRRLQATALNLGRTDQALAVLNSLVMVSWARSLSRLLDGSAAAASRRRRRRRLSITGLLTADIALTIGRWLVRNGILWNCLDPSERVERWVELPTERAEIVRRCRSLSEANAWSLERPVLLVLDWRGEFDAEQEFRRFAHREVPRYANALRMRGAVVAWFCRDDVAGRGWRDGISGLGFPARGQRTYYMVERGHVTAWRTVKALEFPPPLQSETAHVAADAPPAVAQLSNRFAAILTSLILSGEALPSQWRQQVERSFRAAAGLRSGTEA